MRQPLVTIAISCYNAEATIGRAVASALAQDWERSEVLVVDDCSTDGSVAVVEWYMAQSARVRLVRKETNGGAGATRNTIVDQARGEFIAFFDDDDESHPNRVAIQVSSIRAHESEYQARYVACYASGERLYPNGYRKPLAAIGSRPVAPFGRAVADYLLFFRRVPGWFYGAGVPTCALMARRQTFLDIGGFDAGLRRAEDIDFAVRLALAGGHFVGTRINVILQHATEGDEKAPRRNLEAEQALAEKHREYLASIGRYYYARHWPLLRYWHFTGNYPRLALELFGLLVRNPVGVMGHVLTTGPRRVLHERKVRRKERAVQ